jgi:hypothetical protein
MLFEKDFVKILCKIIKIIKVPDKNFPCSFTFFMAWTKVNEIQRLFNKFLTKFSINLLDFYRNK